MSKILRAQSLDSDVATLTEIPSSLAARSLFWKAQFLRESPILPHLPLLFWLMSCARPTFIATLGLGDGVGHFALCQAADKLDLPAACFGYVAGVAPHAEMPEPGLIEHNNALYDHFSQLVPSTLQTALTRLGAGRTELMLVEIPSDADAIARLAEMLPSRMARTGIVVLHGTNRSAATTQLRAVIEAQGSAGGILDFEAGEGLTVAFMGEAMTPRTQRLFEQCRPDQVARGVATTILRRLGTTHILEAQAQALCAGQKSAQADAESSRSRLAEVNKAYDIRTRKAADLQTRIFDLQKAQIAAQTAAQSTAAEAAIAQETAGRETAALQTTLAATQAALAEAQTAAQSTAAEAAIAQETAKRETAALQTALTAAERTIAQRFVELSQLTRMMENVKQDAARLEQRILRLLASRSWQILSPLRKLSLLLSRKAPSAPFTPKYLNQPKPLPNKPV